MRIYTHIFFILSISLAASCVPYYYTSSPSAYEANINTLSYTDEIYDESIKTVYVRTENYGYDDFQTPVAKLQESDKLVLEFDHLTEEFSNFIVKVVHMNSNWTPSGLSELDYLNEYNEFRITDYDQALSGNVDYIHYRFQLPLTKISGNYCLLVYMEEDPEYILFSRRFVVTESLVTIGDHFGDRGMSNFSGHNIDFSANYANSGINDPFIYLKATIRQNNRWDNAISGITPTQLKGDQNIVRYQYFDSRSTFDPGNEFRFFDIRSLISPGMNVDSVRVNATTNQNHAWLTLDRTRNGLAYTFYRDMNGSFRTGTYDRRTTQYTNVTFRLSAKGLNSLDSIYLSGEFTNWKKEERFRMKYDGADFLTCTILLKQGFYNYTYLDYSGGESLNTIEGNHISTENIYEIFLYDTDPVKRSERCVGYYIFNVNERTR